MLRFGCCCLAVSDRIAVGKGGDDVRVYVSGGSLLQDISIDDQSVPSCPIEMFACSALTGLCCLR